MRTALYGEDLAYVHDAGFTADAPAIAQALVGRLRLRGIRGGLIVELGCGSGRLARELIARGFDVLGVDVSLPMLRLARRVAPGASFVHGSLRTHALPPCAGVVAMGESISYAAPGGRPPLLTALFDRVARALQPRGLFVFDVVVTGRPPMVYRTWRAGDDWAVLVDVREKSRPAAVERDVIVLRRVGRLWRRSRERHVAGVYARAAILSDLRAAGFRAASSTRFGRYQPGPRRLAFIADAPAR